MAAALGSKLISSSARLPTTRTVPAKPRPHASTTVCAPERRTTAARRVPQATARSGGTAKLETV